MSYLRWGHHLTFVDGESEDYIYSNGESIVDYGKISDSGFIELLSRDWITEDIMFKEHLIKRLADRLGVKLRDKPLTFEEKMELEKRKRENEI